MPRAQPTPTLIIIARLAHWSVSLFSPFRQVAGLVPRRPSRVEVEVIRVPVKRNEDHASLAGANLRFIEQALRSNNLDEDLKIELREVLVHVGVDPDLNRTSTIG